MVKGGLGSFFTHWQDALGSNLALAVLLPSHTSDSWVAAGSMGHLLGLALLSSLA